MLSSFSLKGTSKSKYQIYTLTISEQGTKLMRKYLNVETPSNYWRLLTMKFIHFLYFDTLV